MRKLFLIATLSAAAALFSTQSSAGEVKRIIPQGKDGDDHYYVVKCQNDSEGSVIIRDKEGKICAQALGGKEICNAGWTIQQAATKACR
jgi:hypothetical protein